MTTESNLTAIAKCYIVYINKEYCTILGSVSGIILVT